MLTRHQMLCATVSALSLMLAGCGGGGGVQVASIPAPPQSPTPTPTPTPTPSCSGAQCLQVVDIFPAVKTTTQFAALGLEASKAGVSASSLARSGFSVQYDAEAGVYIFDVPSSAPAGFYENIGNTPSNRFWNGEFADAPSNTSVQASVFEPRTTNPDIQLTYTSFASYGDLVGGAHPFGFVAFGAATPQAAIPVTGSATYSAVVRGSTLDGGSYIAGSATLNFDFAAGTLGGHFDPTIVSYAGLGEQVSLGRYDFTNTVFGVGSGSFSGQLSNTTLSGLGSFDGVLTGPSAEELMARWSAPYRLPGAQTTSEMFGVLVGKRP